MPKTDKIMSHLGKHYHVEHYQAQATDAATAVHKSHNNLA